MRQKYLYSRYPKMLDKIVGLRKLIISLIILGVAIVITYTKGDVPAGMVSVLNFIFGGFVVGNAIEHITESSTEKATIVAGATNASAPTEIPASAQQIQALDQKIQATSDGVANVQAALVMIIQKYGIDK